MTKPAVVHLKWRTGRKNPFTIYAMVGNEPSDHDIFIGSLNHADISTEAVESHNRSLFYRDHLGRQEGYKEWKSNV